MSVLFRKWYTPRAATNPQTIGQTMAFGAGNSKLRTPARARRAARERGWSERARNLRRALTLNGVGPIVCIENFQNIRGGLRDPAHDPPRCSCNPSTPAG